MDMVKSKLQIETSLTDFCKMIKENIPASNLDHLGGIVPTLPWDYHAMDHIATLASIVRRARTHPLQTIAIVDRLYPPVPKIVILDSFADYDGNVGGHIGEIKVDKKPPKNKPWYQKNSRGKQRRF